MARDVRVGQRPYTKLRADFPHQWNQDRSHGDATLELREDAIVRLEVLDNPYVQPMEFNRADFLDAVRELFPEAFPAVAGPAEPAPEG